MSRVNRTVSAFAAGLVVVLASQFAGRAPAQEETRTALPASQPSVELVQQDEIDELRKNEGSEWWEIKDIAATLAKKDDLRARLVTLLAEPDLAPKVFTGVARYFAEAKERGVIGTILDALAGRDLGNLTEAVEVNVLGEFHKDAPIFDALVAALGRWSATADAPAGPGFGRLTRLFRVLVDNSPVNGGNGRDAARYQAISRILALWGQDANETDAVVATALRAELVVLTGELVDHERRGGWVDWFGHFATENERERQLSLNAIARDAVAGLRKRVDEQTALRRKELAELFARMKQDGDPPTGYLLDADPVIRRAASRTLRAMADGLGPEGRGPAVQEITKALDRGDLDDDRRRTLLEAAGAIGRKLPDVERAQLAAAIFKGPEGLGPEVWSARIKAVAEIGSLDDPGRLARLYDLANDPAHRGDAAWIAVRADVVRACQTLRLEAELAIRALGDVDEDVRGIAALTLAGVKSFWSPELVARLVESAVAEAGTTALTRLLEALRIVVGDRPQFFDQAGLLALIGIEAKADAANDARILAVVLGVTLAESTTETLPPEPIEGLVRAVFGGGASPVDRARLADLLLKSPRPLAARLLGLLLAEAPTTLDRDQTERAVKALIQAPPETVPAQRLYEVALRIAARGDLSGPQRAVLAARLGGVVLDRARAGEVVEGLDLEAADRQVETWRLMSGDADLIARARQRLDELVQTRPEDPLVLSRRARFLEGLIANGQGESAELLAATASDLEAAVAKSGALPAPDVAALHLRLARLRLLQGDAQAFATEIAQAGTGEEVQLLQRVQAVLSRPGPEALAILGEVGEAELRQRPEVYALLRAAACSMSPRIEDRLAVSAALGNAGDPFERELDGECRMLQELDGLVARLGAGDLKEEERAKLAAAPRLATALAARRLLLLDDADLRAQAEPFLVALREWTPARAAEFVLPTAEDQAPPTALRAVLQGLGMVEVDTQKRHARFLKRLSRSLYSP
ncbi:MAG: hypothetical protein H6807_02395 [Planctomycetes bacterium]|nr:hypothetical protein [Planctomycetota bacterium]